MVLAKTIITSVVFTLLVLSSGCAVQYQHSSASLADYPMIIAPKGNFVLYIPDNNFFGVNYFEKKVTFFT